MKSACPFSDNCRTGDFLGAFCRTTKPCSESYGTCHIFIKKMDPSMGQKENSASKTPFSFKRILGRGH